MATRKVMRWPVCSNLSAILAGKRKISASLAGKLGNFFKVSAAVLVPG
jgi:HTH-type transcriptional regulator/antitoxin HigA